MNAVHIGPLALSAGRAGLIGGLLVLLLAGEWLSRRVDRRFSRWTTVTIAAAIAGARAGYVLQNFRDYAAEPWRVLQRTPSPLLSADTADERSGIVPNVVFPTAIEQVDGVRYVFYGMADSKIGVARLDRVAPPAG